jgi:NAD(P)-dependent dehydrogenase (short-subunit alcohol dehydrogenase family)
MIAIRGFASSFAQAFIAHLPEGERVVPVERGGCNTEAERHVFAQGLLRPKKIGEQTAEERAESLQANALSTIEQCNRILSINSDARILIIGSESGFAWSYDDVYAASKAALHRYVETKRIRGNQQLVCIAPTIINDSRMTRERPDADQVRMREMQHPKYRFLTMTEVCKLAHFLLYVDEGYLTNIVIRMNGGAHTA